MQTFELPNRKKKQIPITYNTTPYLALASEPADTMSKPRIYFGLYYSPFIRRRALRRMRRD